MKKLEEVKRDLQSGKYEKKLMNLYCCDAEETVVFADRYLTALEKLEKCYGPHVAAALFSAPGRTEIGGNHTDHQHGRVLAGSVNLDMIAAAAPTDTHQVRVTSEGYKPFVLDLDDLNPREKETNTSISLVRGICAAFVQRGARISGLDVYIMSNVPKGSGISSSAAYEVLIGTIINELFMEKSRISAVEIAQIGQWAENVYFGKPCGLMDQMASGVGGIITIDFADPENPVVEPIPFDFAEAGMALCILDSGADHAGLTDEYAAVPRECKAIARICGAKVLRDVPYEVFLGKIAECRRSCGDRAVLRAFHVYKENERVGAQVEALKKGDFEGFLRLIRESGRSSWEYLQNVIPAGYKAHQDMAVAVAVAEAALDGRGAVRVHGGGFAGTIQAFVPLDILNEFKRKTEAVLGEGRCHVLSIRPVGGTLL